MASFLKKKGRERKGEREFRAPFSLKTERERERERAGESKKHYIKFFGTGNCTVYTYVVRRH